MKRKIINIDEDKCNGCGLCAPACAEGAIQIIDGKARLVAENLCDGIGDCLGECPQGALTLEEREADPFDETAVEEHLGNTSPGGDKTEEGNSLPCGCPGMMARQINNSTAKESSASEKDSRGNIPSQLRQWPVQLTLVPPHAPYFKEGKLLISADCVPFALASFHQNLLKGKALVVGCPKLDDTQSYVDKLTEIIRANDIKEITVAIMEVPCCTGMVQVARKAVEQSGASLQLNIVKVSIEGKIIEQAPAL